MSFMDLFNYPYTKYIFFFFGWLQKINIWINPSNIITTIFTQYNYLGIFSIFLLYIFTLFILLISAKAMNNKVLIIDLWYKMPKFIFGFFLIFLLTIILQKIFNLDLSTTYLQVETFMQFFINILFYWFIN